MRHHFSDEQLHEARELRAGGMSWVLIGRHFGCSDETIRGRLDPAHKRVRWERYAGPKSELHVVSDNVFFMPGEIARVLASVPPDTRTRHARWMGDPLPGRSALDQRRASFPHYSQNPQPREQIVPSQS